MYERYVSKNKIGSNVIFTGKVPWNEIVNYYLISDVFATASTTETQGLTVIEAMAASLPVVCINDDSFNSTVINDLNGIIFNNRREYKKAIIKLFKDREYLDKLSKQARIESEMHSSKYFAEKILDVYNVAIRNNPRHKIPIINKVHRIINGGDSNEEDDSFKS